MAGQGLLNYLHVSKLPVGYIINFRNTVIEFKRFVKTAAKT
jgi:hypothetical protein